MKASSSPVTKGENNYRDKYGFRKQWPDILSLKKTKVSLLCYPKKTQQNTSEKAGC